MRKIKASLSGPIAMSSVRDSMDGKAFAITENVSQSPVIPVSAPVRAAASTASTFPMTSSALVAEVARSVSSVLRSFSPVVASTAVCMAPAVIMKMRM